MKKLFIIIYDDFEDPEKENKFIEAIRSSYISKLGRKNVYMVIVQNDTKSKDIYDTILSQYGEHLSILVTDLENFYGHFTDLETVEWIKLQLPESKWIT